MSETEVVAKLKGDSSDFDEAMDGAEGRLIDFKGAGLAVGAAVAGVGTGLGKVTNKARDMELDFGRLAAASGHSTKSLRAQAKGLSNVTLSQEDIGRSMDRLIERGITSQDEFSKLIPLADKYADAWGVDMAQATETVVDTLKTFGGDAEDMEDHLDTIAFLEKRTSGGMARLERQLRRNTKEFQGLGIGIEDSVAIIRALEEGGMEGESAMQFMGEAVRDSEGDIDKFNDIIGLNEEQLAGAREEMSEFQGATEKGAEAYADSMTLWDEIKFQIDEATLSMGDFLTPVRDVAPLMQAAGGATIFFSTVNTKSLIPALGKAAVASWGFLAPWLPWILLAALVVGAIVLIWKNWDTIFPAMKKVADVALKGITKGLGAAWGFIKGIFTEGLEFVKENWMKFVFWPAFAIKKIVEFFKTDAGKKILGGVEDAFNTALDFIKGLPAKFLQFGKDIINGLTDGIKSVVSAPVDAVKDAAGGLIKGAKGVFGISSPSRVFMGLGENVVQGWEKGLQGMDGAVDMRLPDGIDGLGGAMGDQNRGGGSTVNKFVFEAGAIVLENTDLDPNNFDFDLLADALARRFGDKLGVRG